MLINLIKYVIYGFIQGFTEPLPISSSGHLILFRYLFNTNAFSDLTFEIYLNFASLLAILVIFKDDIFNLLVRFYQYVFKKDKNQFFYYKYCMLILVGTIPCMITGLLFKDVIENLLNYNIKFLGFAFLITAVLLLLTKNKSGYKENKDITYFDAFIIGLFQAFAILPGISRSGAVLVGCLLRGFKKNVSIKYTFMLYLPVSIGTFILSINDLLKTNSENVIPYFIGFVICTFTTYYSTKWLINLVKNSKLIGFVCYLIIIGLMIIMFI